MGVRDMACNVGGHGHHDDAEALEENLQFRREAAIGRDDTGLGQHRGGDRQLRGLFQDMRDSVGVRLSEQQRHQGRGIHDDHRGSTPSP